MFNLGIEESSLEHKLHYMKTRRHRDRGSGLKTM
jgi:hypothetical protein